MADVVKVRSGPYRFMFDKRKRLGMIAPIAIDAQAEQGWTSFELELSPSTNHVQLVARLRDIPSSLLLFLRRICRLELVIDGAPVVIEKAISEGITRLKRWDTASPSSENEYLLFEYPIKNLPRDDKRQGIRDSQIVLAFPMTTNLEPLEENQDVHAFLPLRSYGFRVSSTSSQSGYLLIVQF